FLLVLQLPHSTLFPYTTLFRSIYFQPCRKFVMSLFQFFFNKRNAVVFVLNISKKFFNNVFNGYDSACSSIFVNNNGKAFSFFARSEEHTSELQSRENLVCRLLL